MTTHHEEMAAALLDQMLFSPEAAQALAHTRRRLLEGAVDAAYVDRIGQSLYGARRWTPAQAAAYLRVHTGLATGEFAQVLVGVAESPTRDDERRENQRCLASVNSDFKGELNLTQSAADSDGIFWWEQEITADQSTGAAQPEGTGLRPIVETVTIPPGRVPLEVGYTMPSRTLQHLAQHGGVARWPYGQDSVCVLLAMRPGHEQLRTTRLMGRVA